VKENGINVENEIIRRRRRITFIRSNLFDLTIVPPDVPTPSRFKTHPTLSLFKMWNEKKKKNEFKRKRKEKKKKKITLLKDKKLLHQYNNIEE